MAKLIRRAKRRNRPLAWHIGRWTLIGLGGLTLLYLALVVRFHTSSPKVEIDYAAPYLRAVQAVPADQRAWPIYERALADLAKAPVPLGDDDVPFPVSAAARSGDVPPAVAKYLRAIGPVLDDVAAASHLPAFGGGPFAVEPTASEPLEIRRLVSSDFFKMQAWVDPLLADAALAADEGDGNRALRRLLTLLRLARQVNATPGDSLSGVSRWHTMQAARATARLLHDHPELSSDDQLRDLAHELSVPVALPDAAVAFDAARDALQRMYAGNGRMSAEGFDRLRWQYQGDPRRNLFVGQESPLLPLLQPLAAAAFPSRAWAEAELDRLQTEAAADLAAPLWRVPIMRLEAEWEQHHGPSRASWLYYPLLELSFERHETHRANLHLRVAATAVALELHRRRTGDYPDELAALVPTLLPRVPVNPLTGEPLGYRRKGESFELFVDDSRTIMFRTDDGPHVLYPPSTE